MKEALDGPCLKALGYNSFDSLSSKGSLFMVEIPSKLGYISMTKADRCNPFA